MLQTKIKIAISHCHRQDLFLAPCYCLAGTTHTAKDFFSPPLMRRHHRLHQDLPNTAYYCV